MLTRWLVATFLSLAFGNFATAQIQLPGTVWSVFEERKASVSGIGKDEDSGILRIEFLQGNQFTAFDAVLNVTYTGSYTPKGNGYTYTLSPTSLSVLAAGYELWIERALRDLGLAIDVTVQITKYQGQGKVKLDRRSGSYYLFLKSKVSFDVSAAGYRTRKGKSSTRAGGAQII
ncbi:MAG: hypothetical protein IPN34_08635 [Planctomycetes bacterium]|nr:hypothetical protein [Planctomycetota bacterium]